MLTAEGGEVDAFAVAGGGGDEVVDAEVAAARGLEVDFEEV